MWIVPPASVADALAIALAYSIDPREFTLIIENLYRHFDDWLTRVKADTPVPQDRDEA